MKFPTYKSETSLYREVFDLYVQNFVPNVAFYCECLTAGMQESDRTPDCSPFTLLQSFRQKLQKKCNNAIGLAV